MSAKSKLLPRRKLTEKLLRTIAESRLTMVVAPMGYGKTTVAAALRRGLEGKAYYYAVPDGPHEARFLWRDMFDCFQAQRLPPAAILRRYGFPDTAATIRQVQGRLGEVGKPLYLFLDDYHRVTDPALTAFWEILVKSELPDFHLVLFSRTTPQFQLGEPRIKGLATIYEHDLLAFSEGETGEFFRLHEIGDPQAAAEAHRYSEGWPAAVWLCLQSWRDCGRIIPSPDLESLLANLVGVYDQDERDLLMRLSVLESFTEADAAEISASLQTPARLRTLREKNAFLSYDRKTGHYQFHSIFRDFLSRELTAAHHIDQPALRRRAGECCAAKQKLLPALRLFAKAGRDEDYIRLLDLFLQPKAESESAFFVDEVFNIVTALPWRVRLQNPLGYLAFVYLFSQIINDHRTDLLLAEIEELFADSPAVPEYLRQRVLGEVEIIRGVLAFPDFGQGLLHYEKAAALLPGSSIFLSKDTAWNFGHPNFAFMLLSEPGQYQDLVDFCKQNSPVYTKLAGGIGRGADKVVLAEYMVERGELTPAEPLLKEGLRLGRDERQAATAIMAGFNLGRAYAKLGAEGRLSASRRFHDLYGRDQDAEPVRGKHDQSPDF